jgi:pimeloyl-ACP methyl ester carboxylesterase
MLHGYMGHAEMLRPLARRLLEQGWGDVHRVGYPSLWWTFEQIIDEIDRVVTKVSDQHGGQVDLIGHSLGAIACRAWIKLEGGHTRVRRFVSLGGPHAGTSLHRIVPSPVRPVFDPRGAWVRRLAEGAEPVPTTVIRARYDHQIIPPQRGSIPGVKEHVVQAHGHNGLLWSPEAHQCVIDALLSPATPTK